jgi:hypothetical protein
MKYGKPTSFSGISLNFSGSSLDFIGFLFFKFEFLNYNRPVFNEQKKSDRTDFIGFHDNLAVFINI